MLQKRGMTTYEYIRWQANNTRASKIVKRKSDKETREQFEVDEIGHQASPGPALPLNVDFMDSNKRLAGLMTMSASKPVNEGIYNKTDSSDVGLNKVDASATMANTATNFGVGVDKISEIEKQNTADAHSILSINKLNSLEDLKRSGLEINVTPQVSVTNR